MWHSQSITSLKATKSLLEYLCISPFKERNWSMYIYCISIVFIHQIVFVGTFYHSMIYTSEFRVRANDYDTFYFVRQMKKFAMGPCFSLGIIFSLCSRSAQLKLQKRLASLDIKLKSHLRVEPSFHRLNIEFITCCVFIIASFYGSLFHFIYGRFDLHIITRHIYYSCSLSSGVYFYLYGLYTVYWARTYTNRSEYIIDALKTMTSQKFISESSLSMILELINLLFHVRESIQNAFGPILFMIVLVMTFESAESSFGVIHIYETQPGCNHFLGDYLFWFLVLSSEFVFIFVSFNKMGNVVSEFKSLKLFHVIFVRNEIGIFAQVTKMQGVMSQRYLGHDKNIEACVSAFSVFCFL